MSQSVKSNQTEIRTPSGKDGAPRYYIETYGCQMNEYDSLVARRILDEAESRQVDSPEQADLILLNTCAIRENAHTKIYNRLRSFEHLHKKGANIGVLGCMGQNLREEILFQNLPLDFIIGPDELRRLSEISKARQSGEKIDARAHLKLSRREVYEDLAPSIEHHLNENESRVSAFVTIQRGCDNFCTFCVVPYTRGRERSRSAQSVVDEVRQLEEGGIRSVILLGQNVNSYHHESTDFTGLIEKLLCETTIPRIYFTSPHPKDFPSHLIDLMAAEERFCNQVHMPLQSGSDEVLRRMKRNYTSAEFLRLVEAFRTKVKDVAISTDVIAGFAGETATQFEDTVRVMEEADFDSAFMFAYSKRKGTIAGRLYEDDVPEEEKKRRLDVIISAQLKRSLRHNREWIGREAEIMVEGPSRRSEHDFTGRIRNGRKVVFPVAGEKPLPGENVRIRVEDCTSATLLGRMIEKSR